MIKIISSILLNEKSLYTHEVLIKLSYKSKWNLKMATLEGFEPSLPP